VAAKRRILTFTLVAAISLLSACGGGSSPTNSPGTQTPSVSIVLKPAPTTTTVAVASSTGVQFTPVVSNDPANYGVDWAVTCTNSLPAGCGTLGIPTMHSASGSAVAYLPPADFAAGTLTVDVTAFATADHTKNVTTAITVTSYVNALSGTYIFQVKGSDSLGDPYEITGAVVLDGKGNITSGQETMNSLSETGFSTLYTLVGSIAPSTYFIGPDGRGIITLNLQQANNTTASPVLETFSLVVTSSSQALIAENDLTSSISSMFGSTGAGTLELQDPTAATVQPSGAYAFVTSGTDFGNVGGNGTLNATGFGGVFNIDDNPSPGAISGNGSLADQDYYNPLATERELLSCVPPTGVTGSVSPPSSLGVITIRLTGATCFGLVLPASIQFTGYIVDATHIMLIESDDIDGQEGFLTAGIAINQGAAAGTFTNASLSGAYVSGILGYDDNFAEPSSFTSAGVVNADGDGNLTGITDTFFPGDSAAFPANLLTGTYAVDSTLIGRADLSLTFTGVPRPRPDFLFYLTGNGTPPLVFYAGGKDGRYPATGVGIAYPQAANASTLSFGNPETYGVSFTQQNGSENDGTGTLISAINGISGLSTGVVDDPNNDDFLGSPFILSDTFALPADNFGRITGTFMKVTGALGPDVDYYLIDDNQGFFIETDLSTSGQVGLGYFTQACDVTAALTSPTGCQTLAESSRRAASRRSSHVLQKNLLQKNSK